MTKWLLMAAGVLGTVVVAGAADTKTGGRLRDPADSTFINEAASGGMMEVELGKMAQDKAASAEVKSFGQRMVDDHSKANDRLRAIAQEHGVTLTGSLPREQQQTVDHLGSLNGAAFDRAYMSAMVKDHVEDVGKFRREANRAEQTPAKQFAADTLPVLQHHLQLAKSTAAKVGAGSTKARSHGKHASR
jgi:putative membrane protein